MREYARQRGLRRLMISVPLLTPYLSSLWLGLVTPVYARVGHKLVESMRNPTVVCDPSARDVFPLRPRPLREAIERAIANEDSEMAAHSLVGCVLFWRPDEKLGRCAVRHADR